MSSRPETFASRGFIATALVAFALFGAGCGGSGDSNSFSAAFTASTTASTANLVKLVPKGSSGARLVVQTVVYGPTTSTDLYSFAFDVVIGDPSVLSFVPGGAAAGGALTAATGQTIQAIAAPATSDPTHIVVGVSKLGGGNGNGVAGASAVVVELAFDFLKAGTSTLQIATSPTPTVTDHNGATIGSIDFDSSTGTATGVSVSGGGPY